MEGERGDELFDLVFFERRYFLGAGERAPRESNISIRLRFGVKMIPYICQKLTPPSRSEQRGMRLMPCKMHSDEPMNLTTNFGYGNDAQAARFVTNR